MNIAITLNTLSRVSRGLGLEAIAYLFALGLTIIGCLLLLWRDETGLERYRLDQAAQQVDIPQISMLDAFCQSAFSDLNKCKQRASKDKLGIIVAVARILGSSQSKDPSGGNTKTLTIATLQEHAERLRLRYIQLDRAMSEMLGQGVEWDVVSEAYAVQSSDGLSKDRWDQAKASLETAREASRLIKPLERRFNRAALTEAFQSRWKQYQGLIAQGNTPGAAEALWRMSALLDGEGNSVAARSVEHLLDARKNSRRAAQAEMLVRYGGFLWLGWAGWLWLAVQIGRRVGDNTQWAGVVLLSACSLAALEHYWLGLELAKAFYWIAGGLGILMLAISRYFSLRLKRPKRFAAHWSLLPGWLLFVGMGWLLVIDLSLHFYPDKRFLIVDQYTSLTWSLLILTLVPLFVHPIIQTLAKLNGWIHAPTLSGRAMFVTAVIVIPAAAYIAHDPRFLGLHQSNTGEPIKVLAVVLLAWHLLNYSSLIRAAGLTIRQRVRLLMPSALIALALALAFVLTEDYGPLLVLLICALLYWAGVYFGLKISFAILIIGLLLLFSFGEHLSEVISNRVASAIDPFSAATDDMARLTWFKDEVPILGFGLGNAPWCGYAAHETCAGLPDQVQSDYTFTALLGIYGIAGWGVVLLVSAWFLMLMRAHWDNPVSPSSLMKSSEALRSGYLTWLAVIFGTLFLTQMWVTVAGNMRWLPLTGITFPWLSFGFTALLFQTIFYALLAEKEGA